MKILQILHSYPPQSFGGTEFYTQSLIEVLGIKHQILVIYSRNTPNTELIAQKNPDDGNIRLKSVERNQTTNFESTYFNPSADHEILDIIQDFAPDIVHIEHLLNHSISLVNKLSALSLPIIFTLHDYWYLCPQCFLTKFNGDLCKGPEKGRNCLSCENADSNRYIPLANAIASDIFTVNIITFLKKHVPSYFRKKFKQLYLNFLELFAKPNRRFFETKIRLQKMVEALNKADLIIAPSRLLAERYKKEGVKNVMVLAHGIRGISDKAFKADKYKNIEYKQKITFAYMGSILRYKGIHIAIEAFNNFISSKAELLIYGKFNQNNEYEKELLSMCRHSNIRFMGFIEHGNIYETLKNIDVIVIPSICTENYPLIANEAFLAKTPVIASNVGGLNELITDGVSGFICEPGNSVTLFNIMNKIVKNPHVLKYMSDNIPHVKNMDEHAHEIELLYQEVIRFKSKLTK